MNPNKPSGTITNFNPDKNFGFIRTSAGKDIFFHIREFRAGRTPVIGESVLFDLGEDKQGRACAINVQETSFVLKKQSEQAKRNEARQAYEMRQEIRAQKQGLLNAVCLFALIYFVLLTVVVLLFDLNQSVLLCYVVMSLISLAAYYKDKQAAQNNDRRTPENTMHLYDVLGGWIGASFAQRLWNHKTTKQEFRVLYYATIAVNIIGVMAVLYLGKNQ